MKLLSSISTAVTIALSPIAESQIANAVQSHCCYYNDRMINCNFMTSDHSLLIEWSDGLKESYTLVTQSDLTDKTYWDVRGGIWKWVLDAQGNISLTNPANGNRILKPLQTQSSKEMSNVNGFHSIMIAVHLPASICQPRIARPDWDDYG